MSLKLDAFLADKSGGIISLYQGDITQLGIDAIVNATNENMTSKTGGRSFFLQLTSAQSLLNIYSSDIFQFLVLFTRLLDLGC